MIDALTQMYMTNKFKPLACKRAGVFLQNIIDI